MKRTRNARTALPVTAALLVLLAACDDTATAPHAEPEPTAVASLAAPQAPVATCGADTDVRLLAGQNIDAGTVTVGNDQDNLYVTFATSGGWTLSETHLAAGDAIDDIPTNNAGNPQLGHFPHDALHSPAVSSHTYTIPLAMLELEDEELAFIAAHADLGGEGAWGEGSQISDRGGNWAMYFTHRVADCAVATISTDGGTIETLGGTATLTIPAGALDEPTTITIEAVGVSGDGLSALTTSTDPFARAIPGTAYDFGPDGLTFNIPATLTIAYDEAQLAAARDEPFLKVAIINGVFFLFGNSTVDEQANTVSAPIDHFSTYFVTPASSDLSVAMSVAPDPVEAGQALSHTLTVSNSGPDAADSVEVVLSVEDGSTTVGAIPTECGRLAIPDPQVKAFGCLLGTMAAGASSTLTFEVVPQSAGDALASRAVVRTRNGCCSDDPTFANNVARDTTSVTVTTSTEADLGVALLATPDPVQVGGQITHSVTLTNHGPAVATDADVLLLVSDPISLAALDIPAGCVLQPAINAVAVQCRAATLAAGAQAQWTVPVTADQAGTTIQSGVSSLGAVGTSDPNPSNDTAGETTAVVAVAAADLAITMTVTPDPSEVGAMLRHSVEVANLGTDDVTGVTIAVRVFDTQLTGASAPGCQALKASDGSHYLYLCDVVSLVSGSTQTRIIDVETTTVQTLTSTAAIDGWNGPPDPDLTNNSTTETTDVQAP